MTRSDYIFTDVSRIDITGVTMPDRSMASGHNPMIEDIAYLMEGVAERRRAMGYVTPITPPQRKFVNPWYWTGDPLRAMAARRYGESGGNMQIVLSPDVEFTARSGYDDVNSVFDGWYMTPETPVAPQLLSPTVADMLSMFLDLSKMHLLVPSNTLYSLTMTPGTVVELQRDTQNRTTWAGNNTYPQMADSLNVWTWDGTTRTETWGEGGAVDGYIVNEAWGSSSSGTLMVITSAHADGGSTKYGVLPVPISGGRAGGDLFTQSFWEGLATEAGWSPSHPSAAWVRATTLPVLDFDFPAS